MSTTLAENRAARRHPPKPCDACGTLTRKSKHVPGIGEVGSTCYQKVAALNAVLEQRGLTELFGGRREFAPQPSEDADGISQWVFPAHILTLRDRAEKLGLRFEWNWPRRAGPAECWVSLPRSIKLRRRLLARLERVQAAVA